MLAWKVFLRVEKFSIFAGRLNSSLSLWPLFLDFMEYFSDNFLACLLGGFWYDVKTGL